MSRVYRKPPIIEALCEFQFVEEGWDWTIPGLIYQELKDRFPQKRQAQVVEFEVQAELPQFSQRMKGGPGRMQFLRADESALVQIGPNLLAVNHLPPYPHWSEFKVLVFDALSIYERVARPKGFRRIGLRYINRIEIPETAFDFSAYFNLGPHLPDEIAAPYGTILMRVGLQHETEQGQLLLTFASTPNNDAPTSAFILDLDFVTIAEGELTLETARDWVEGAHGHIETAFEACMTDRLRDIFEEVKP
jgi:uncharacterized protein (TIGR04255 family)